MARALIVACGCRGRALGTALLEQGWQVRGTSRCDEGLAAIEAAGIEPALADPERLGTLLDLVGDVTAVHWLLGSATGEEDLVAAVNGERLESLLERLVDTPVRGFVYEAAGSVAAEHLRRGREAVERAATTWRIPALSVDADPADHDAWLAEMKSRTNDIANLGNS